MHGAALDAGLELALGCDARVASAGTMLGFTDVSRGAIPGAGGTQRLPRLVGIPKAIALIGGGEQVSAEAALVLGIVDAIASADLRGVAIGWARKTVGRKSRVRELAVPVADETAVARPITDALRAEKSRPAVRAAVDLIASAARLSIDEGLAQERHASPSTP
jgi:3-hydroxyacyl-CoA dehydrogenase